jgi:hypothetical protein
VNSFPHSTTGVFFLKSNIPPLSRARALFSTCTVTPALLPWAREVPRLPPLKIAAKKAKKIAVTHHSDSPTVGQWDCSKFMEKDLHKAAKEELLKDDVETVCVLVPEATRLLPRYFG